MVDVQVLAVAVSALLLLLVIELVRRRLLGEEYAFVWILGALAVLTLSLWPGALDAAARWLGVRYGPALLLLILAFLVFVGLLSFSVVVSRQRSQIERLIEDVAILDARLRDLPGAARAPKAEVRASAAPEARDNQESQ